MIPFFKKILLEKNYFPVTDKEMTRFYESKDGVKFVLKSFERMYGGEIFIPKLIQLKF